MSTTGGYGRLVVRFDVEMEAEVRISSGVLIVQFKRPVDISVDRITAGAGQYFGAARRDPDGKAVRFALQQKLKVSTMTAGERLFVDLMPESWTGEPPGLPREVVEDLARRARAADQQAQQKLALEAQRRVPVVRVRVAASRHSRATSSSAGADAGRLRALQGQADAELRRTFAVRSVGRQALAAEDGRGDRRRQRRRQVEREVLVRAAGRRPLVPRGCELRGRRHAGDVPRRPADRSSAGRRPGQRSAGRRSPARHRSGQGPAGAERQKSGRQKSERQS